MSDDHQESQALVLLDYLRQHPGLALSISYALLTLCGILYSASLYEEFGIAILKLANISDLMIAGLSEPVALLMFFGGILVAAGYDLFSKRSYKTMAKWREQPKSIKRTLIMAMVYRPKTSRLDMLMAIILFILYAFIFVSLFAEWHSDRIKQGRGDKIIVSSEALGDEARQLTLLGSTTNYLITYNPDDEQVTVIPVENIDKLNAVIPEPEK